MARYPRDLGPWLVYHYYNEGLQTHPMHQNQFPQLVFAKDGIPLARSRFYGSSDSSVGG